MRKVNNENSSLIPDKTTGYFNLAQYVVFNIKGDKNNPIDKKLISQHTG